MAFEVLMPQLGLTMEEGTVTQWIKHEGDEVKTGDVIVEITTDKLTNEVESEFDGILLKIVAHEGEDIPVRGVLAYIGLPGETLGSATSVIEATNSPSTVTAVPTVERAHRVNDGTRIRISPLARKIATKMDIDYTVILGSGSSGRITQKDILAVAEAKKRTSNQTSVPAETTAFVKLSLSEEKKATPVATTLELMEGDTVVKMSGIRKVVAERMLKSHTQIPCVTQNVKVDVSELMKFRKMLQETTGKKYSVNDLVMKATAKALRAHPEILVSLDGDKIIHRAHVNLGMAVSLDTGLIVPVIKDADKMGLDQLSSTAKDLAARAKENKLLPDEFKGSTFSISNLGMFGIETFNPIINQPDAGILGVCAIQDELAMDEMGKIYYKQVMRISMTMDHRLLDGAVVAKFQLSIKELLENPMSIVL